MCRKNVNTIALENLLTNIIKYSLVFIVYFKLPIIHVNPALSPQMQKINWHM